MTSMEWHLPDRVLSIARRPLVMGILNVTPDSFSDGGKFISVDTAVAHGVNMVRQGADILDIGGESTRPGATPVSLEEELQRVVPVVKKLAAQVSVPMSVDTYKAEVARQSLAAGARIINDVSGLTADAEMASVARTFGAGIMVMHMQGTPATMQLDPHYDDVVADIGRFFEERLQALAAEGLDPQQVALDPGIGFGKTREHNLALLARLQEFRRFGRPVCLGVSRKGFLGRLLDRPVEGRLTASLAAICHASTKNAVQVVRVHDVQETCDALTVIAAIEAHA